VSDEHSPIRSNEVEAATGIWLPEAVLRFTFERSSGPGGQNVNKRSTKAVLRVSASDLADVLTPTQLNRLRRLAGRRLNQQDEFMFESDNSRSQRQNRDSCIAQLGQLIQKAKRPVRRRKKTRPSVASKRQRIADKRHRGRVKDRRRRPKRDDAR